MIFAALYMARKSYLILMLIFFVCFCPDYGFSEEYSTWKTFEPDKCGSAWLLKRFVVKEAIFNFFPKGEQIASGIPFDTPEAELRRYHNMSAFESILRKYKLNDPVLMEMGKIFHDIEINSWGIKVKKESRVLESSIRKIVTDYSEPNDILIKSFEYFDILYKELKRSCNEK